MSGHDFQIPYGIALHTQATSLPSNATHQAILKEEMDVLVFHKNFEAFRSNIEDLGFRRRRLPSTTPAHVWFERWENDCQRITCLDLRIGPCFSGSGMFRYQLQKQYFDVCFVPNPTIAGTLQITEVGRTLFYAANCAWEKAGRFNEAHAQKLRHYASQAVGPDAPAFVHALFASLHSVSPVTPQCVLQKAVKDAIRPLFRRRLNSIGSLMGRRSVARRSEYVGVLFVGTDASGKSAIVQALHELRAVKTTKLYLGEGKGGWRLRTAKWACAQRNNWIVHLYRYILLPIEFFVRIATAKFRARGRIMLVDRVPGWAVLAKGRVLRTIYSIIFPKFDVVVELRATTAVLAKRKPDEVDEVRAQKDIIKWSLVASTLSDAPLRIDTSDTSIDVCVKAIVAQLVRSPAYSRAIHNDGK